MLTTLIGVLIFAYGWLTYQLMLPNRVTALDAPLWQCPSQQLIGLPCPGCGTTRSVLSILHGSFLEALWLNPLGYLALFFLISAPLIGIYDSITKKRILMRIYQGAEMRLQRKVYWIAVMILLSINWAWNWIKFT
jgi:hypothetical protein